MFKKKKINIKNFNEFTFQSKLSMKTKKLIFRYIFEKQFKDELKKYQNNNILFYKSFPQIGFFWKFINTQLKPYNDVSIAFFKKEKKIIKRQKKIIQDFEFFYNIKKNLNEKKSNLKSEYIKWNVKFIKPSFFKLNYIFSIKKFFFYFYSNIKNKQNYNISNELHKKKYFIINRFFKSIFYSLFSKGYLNYKSKFFIKNFEYELYNNNFNYKVRKKNENIKKIRFYNKNQNTNKSFFFFFKNIVHETHKCKSIFFFNFKLYFFFILIKNISAIKKEFYKFNIIKKFYFKKKNWKLKQFSKINNFFCYFIFKKKIFYNNIIFSNPYTIYFNKKWIYSTNSFYTWSNNRSNSFFFKFFKIKSSIITKIIYNNLLFFIKKFNSIQYKKFVFFNKIKYNFDLNNKINKIFFSKNNFYIQNKLNTFQYFKNFSKKIFFFKKKSIIKIFINKKYNSNKFIFFKNKIKNIFFQKNWNKQINSNYIFIKYFYIYIKYYEKKYNINQYFFYFNRKKNYINFIFNKKLFIQNNIKNFIFYNFNYSTKNWFNNFNSIQRKIKHNENENFSFIEKSVTQKYKTLYFSKKIKKIIKKRKILTKIKTEKKKINENDIFFKTKYNKFYNKLTNNKINKKKNQIFYIIFYIININWIFYNYFNKSIFSESWKFENWIKNNINIHSFFILWKQNTFNQTKFFKTMYNFVFPWNSCKQNNFIVNENIDNKFFITFYKNYEYSINFNALNSIKLFMFKLYINKYSLQLIVSPKKNNTICTIIPYYNRKNKKKIYYKSAGTFSKAKGYIRRSRQTKKNLYQEAAFQLIRKFKKDAYRHKFIIFKLYKFYNTIKKKFKEKTSKYIEINFFNFFKKQVNIRFPIIKFEFPKSHFSYGGNKTFKRRKQKKIKPIKKFSF